MTQTRSRASICRLASASSGRWPYAMETRSMVASGTRSGAGRTLEVGRLVLATRRQDQHAEVGRLARADAAYAEQRIHGRGAQPRHLAQRDVMEDDIRRDAARAGGVEADGASGLAARSL